MYTLSQPWPMALLSSTPVGFHIDLLPINMSYSPYSPPLTPTSLASILSTFYYSALFTVFSSLFPLARLPISPHLERLYGPRSNTRNMGKHRCSKYSTPADATPPDKPKAAKAPADDVLADVPSGRKSRTPPTNASPLSSPLLWHRLVSRIIRWPVRCLTSLVRISLHVMPTLAAH